MIQISFTELDQFVYTLLIKMGMSPANARIMTEIYISTTKRGVGHHDIRNDEVEFGCAKRLVTLGRALARNRLKSVFAQKHANGAVEFPVVLQNKNLEHCFPSRSIFISITFFGIFVKRD